MLDLFRALQSGAAESVSESYLLDQHGASRPVLTVDLPAAAVAKTALSADTAYWRLLGAHLDYPLRLTFISSHTSAVVDVALPILDQDILSGQGRPGSPDTPLTGLHVDLTAACSFREPLASDRVEVPTT